MGNAIRVCLGACLCLGLLSGSGCFVDRSGVDPAGAARSSCAAECQNGGVCVGNECVCGPVDFLGPTCSERIDDCLEVDCQNGVCVDLVRDFACDCQEGWTLDAAGVCAVEVLSCDTPNACINGTCREVGSAITCDCDEGFKGTNCAFALSCDEPPPPPPNAVEVARSGATELGDTVTFSCRPGFEPASTTIVCQADETWETAVLDCVDEPGCGIPPPILYGDVTTPTGNDEGAIAYYSCDPGFFLVAFLQNNTIVCLDTLEWTQLWGQCLPVGRCADDPCVNGTCTDYEGTVGTFECTCDPGWSGPTCAI